MCGQEYVSWISFSDRSTNKQIKISEYEIKGLLNKADIFCSQLYIEIPLFKASLTLFDNYLTYRPTERQTDQQTKMLLLEALSLELKNAMT